MLFENESVYYFLIEVSGVRHGTLYLLPGLQFGSWSGRWALKLDVLCPAL